MAVIMVRFGDNDFYTTWMAVLKSAASDKSFFQVKDKTKLAFMLSHAAFGMYVMHQNRCEYNGLEKFDEKYIVHMQSYLSISPNNILLDEEVDAYLSETKWDNGDTYYVYDYDCQPQSI